MEVDPADPVICKQLSGRKKKKLFLKIKSQMEFYFSDSNLAKDKFLQNLIEQNPEGYVELEVFKSFNKIKELTEETDIISAALSKSNILDVNDDKTKVRRVTPLGPMKNFDACTLYVEKLPSYADYKWIKDVFEHFGVVDYINIPRFKTTNRIKGFAFVEFSNPESVAKAIEHYKSCAAKQNTESEEENVNSKQGKVRKSSQLNNGEEKNSKKRKVSSEVDSPTKKNCDNEIKSSKVHVEKYHANSDTEKEKHVISHPMSKKRKNESNECEIPVKKLKKFETQNPEQCLQISADEVVEKVQLDQDHLVTADNKSANEAANNSEDETQGKGKRKRNHKKRHNNSERPLLRVMSKYEWKTYRNKYLDLQRSTMSHIKKHMMLETQELKELEMSAKSESESVSSKKGFQFQPGVILKITFTDSIENTTEIKDKVKTTATVAFIDASLGHSEMFVRCHNSEDAQTIFQEEKLHHMGTVELLKDTEEEAYWKKIEEDRKNKFSVPLTRKKRGRDKIIAKAAKLAEQKNKHIYFDE